MLAIGIDIGGTSIKGAAVNDEGKVFDVFSMPVIKGEKQEETINKLAKLICEYMKEHNYNKDNVVGIGMGVPGTLNTSKGTVDYSNNLDWWNLPISKMISDATGLPVRITNDANAAALAEAKYGAGRKYKNIVMLTLGTGVGGGVKLLRQSPLTGAGLGGDAVRKYILDHNIYSLMVYYAHLHNVFLEVWAEGGIAGLLTFLGASLWGVKRMAASGACRRKTTPARLTAAACCAGVAGSLLTGLVDYIWAYPRVMCIFWFVFALGLAAVRLTAEGEAEEKED